MKRASSLFPLIIVALLAAASFWLEHVVRNETRNGLGKDRHDPDAIVHNFAVERFDRSGTLRSRLTASKLTHYPDTDTADVEKPHVSFLQEASVTNFSSEHALADNRQRNVLMFGQVRGERPATPGNSAQTLSTDELTVWVDDEIARTQHPVRYTSGGSQIDAIGADWNNLTGLLNLHGNVQATLQPKPATPATP